MRISNRNRVRASKKYRSMYNIDADRVGSESVSQSRYQWNKSRYEQTCA